MTYKDPTRLNNCVQPIRFFRSARRAFQAILDGINFEKTKGILLPAYIGITDREGSGIYDPILNSRLPHDFYPVDRYLTANVEALEQLMKSGNYRALLVVHYFGFCQNRMDKIIGLCEKYDVLLIEDCAHAMRSSVSEGQLGELGDFSFYSIHKFLAVEDGGIMRINNPDYLHLLDRDSEDETSSKALDIYARSDFDLIKVKRRTNYLVMEEAISDLKGAHKMFPYLPEGITPHNFPLIITDYDRKELYFQLIKLDVPTIALYYRMIEPIYAGLFPESIFVSDRILNLPIHQDIESAEIEEMILKLYGTIK